MRNKIQDIKMTSWTTVSRTYLLMREEAKKKIGARVIGTRKVLEAAY